ncbi:MAG: precorrin-2 C(20)-methyltransferase [Chloroflexi bacterium]|nr:precorrin-2 C(20)-methyltransferase [Chloroflexota bacterium]
MTGTLYGVGVGPGDPDLLTLKAARLIETVHVLAVPVTQADGGSYALTIVAQWVRPEQTMLKLHFPMVRDQAVRDGHRRAAAEALIGEVRAGRDVAFLTEGDPLLHSTFGYILEHLPGDIPVEIVPGVSSIMAAAAQAQTPLVMGDERLAVLSATFESLADLEAILKQFDTVVLLKINRVLDQVIDALGSLELLESAVFIERASHAEGRVVRDVLSLRGTDVHYMSLLIISGGRMPRED